MPAPPEVTPDLYGDGFAGLAVEVPFDGEREPPVVLPVWSAGVHRKRNPLTGASIPVEWTVGERGYPCVQDPEERARRTDLYARFVLPEHEVLARVAFALTRNNADAEDLVQETLLSAYRSIERFDGAHPRAWLFTIMRNTEAKRHRRRRPQLLRHPDSGDAVEPIDGDLPSPEDLVVGAEFDAVVLQCLCALPDRHRQVIELVDIDGLSYAEAAEALGVPVGTVMSRLHRARTRIRQRLSAAGLAPKRSMR